MIVLPVVGRQVPETEKQPVVMLRPLVYVDVAAPVTLRLATDTLPEKVEVEFTPPTLRNPYMVLVDVVPETKFAVLFIEKIDPGVVVPIPILLEASIKSADVPETVVPLLL